MSADCVLRDDLDHSELHFAIVERETRHYLLFQHHGLQ